MDFPLPRNYQRLKLELLIFKITQMVIVFSCIFLSLLFVYLLTRYSVITLFAKIIFFLIPLIIILLLSTFRLKREARVKIGWGIICVLFIIYSLELLQPGSPIFPDADTQRIKQWKKLGLDIRSKAEVLQDFKQEGYETGPFMIPSVFFSLKQLEINKKRIFPLSGISNYNTLLCNESGKWITYRSDEHGFNNPQGLYDNQVDMAVLGDSFVQGYCVESDKNMVSLLRNKYKKVLNLGVGGAGPLTDLAIFREYVEKIQPKRILWVYTETTINRLDLLENVLLPYLNSDYQQELFYKKPEIDNAYKEFLDKGEKAREYRDQVTNKWLNAILLRSLQRRISNIVGNFQKQKIKKLSVIEKTNILRQILTLAKTTTNKWRGELIFVYLSLSDKEESQEHEEIISLVKELNIPFIDLYPVFMSHPDSLSLYPFRKPAKYNGYHFNEEGYRVVSEAIEASLDNHNY